MWGLSLVHGIAMLPVGMAYTFFALGMQPIENSLVAHLTPSRLRSFAYSLKFILVFGVGALSCLLYTSPSPRDGLLSRMPSSA